MLCPVFSKNMIIKGEFEMSTKSLVGFISGVLLIIVGIVTAIFMVIAGKNGSAESGTIAIGYGAAAFFVILGIVIMTVMFRESANDSLLDTEGIFAEGEILKTKKDESGMTYAYIRYYDDMGAEQFFEECFFSGIHREGEKVQLRYVRKKNGKYLAQALDRG